jgi:hypothetical protein
MQVRELDRQIQQLERDGVESPPQPFSPPAEVHLDEVVFGAAAVDREHRAEMSEVIARSVQRDFERRAEQVRRQSQRAAKTLLANASAQVEDQVARERDTFAASYDSLAHQYADEAGEIILDLLELRSSPVDPDFFPPEVRTRRAEERREFEQRLEHVRARRDEALDTLQNAHRERILALREAARTDALARAAEQELRTLAELEARRRLQQTELETDLERALQPAATSEAMPSSLELPRARQAIGRRLPALNQALVTTLAAQRQSRTEAIRALQHQRRSLATLLGAATRTDAMQVATEHGLSLRFDRERSDPTLTSWLAARLTERWGFSEGGPIRKRA